MKKKKTTNLTKRSSSKQTLNQDSAQSNEVYYKSQQAKNEA